MSVFSPGDRASRKRLPDPGPGSLLALIAPAGYGKSALLASALGNRNRPALLLALQDWHGDVNAIHDALQRAFSPLVATANGASAEWSADNGSWMSVVWPRLRAALDKQPSLFMVDNLEQLIDEGARQALETVIRDLPDSCIVIVAGRRMPVGFGQATGRQVLELGDQFLTMSPSEVFDLFGSLDLNAEPRLHPLTLGWPAAVWTGVHLVRSGRPITVAALAERLKPYLEEEVFAGLPKATLRLRWSDFSAGQVSSCSTKRAVRTIPLPSPAVWRWNPSRWSSCGRGESTSSSHRSWPTTSSSSSEADRHQSGTASWRRFWPHSRDRATTNRPSPSPATTSAEVSSRHTSSDMGWAALWPGGVACC